MGEEDLIDFVVKAKKETYASGKRKISVRIPGSKEMHYAEGHYEYIDMYFGDLAFNGIETVFDASKPVWGMVYSGAVLNEYQDVSALYSFLKKCLFLIQREAPFRGPKYYDQDEYVYSNDFSGDIHHFIGYERIDMDGETIYELHYSGGDIL